MSFGYIKGKPDVSWWIQQIRFGTSWRKKMTYQDRWPHWVRYYRNEFDPGVLSANIFFRMVRTIVPRIYFRNPSVSISPSQPGMLNWAFAQVLERVDNKLIRSMRLKKYFKKSIQHSWFYGTGFIKTGFGAAFSYDFEKHSVEAPLARNGKRALETFANIHSDLPWVRSAHPGNIIIPEELDDFDDIPWIAEWIRRPIDDVRDDPRLSNTKNLGPSSRQNVLDVDRVDAMRRNTSDMIDLLEIHDIRTGKVIVLAPSSSDRILLYEDDGLMFDGMNNYFPIVFNPNDNCAWGIPDSKILEPHQLELNHLRTIEMYHWRLSVIKILAKRGALAPDQAEKLVSETVKPVIETTEDPRVSVQFTDGGGIPAGLFEADAQLMRDIREVTGFSRNEFGEHMPASSRTSATESRIVKLASEIRIDERRDEVADVLVNVMTHINRLIFEHWSGEQVIDVVGPLGVPLWVKFKPKILQEGNYHINVDPDNSLPESKDVREQKAVQLYGLLKENPLIDPIRLTRYLLHELHGVQFDDMMRGMPPGLGGPTQPLEVQQYAQIAGQLASLAPQALAQGGNPTAEQITDVLRAAEATGQGVPANG